MRHEFHFQDPTAEDTVYLYEALVEAVGTATGGRGIFAFVTRDGVDSFLLDPVVVAFLQRAGFSLLIGIDAITNRPTLERVLEVRATYPNLEARVFWNPTNKLFHPKIAHFRYRNGAQRLIVGSGNLTPGGLRQNFEAYSVVTTRPGEELDLSAWDAFLERHVDRIREIDAEALERAGRNVVIRRPRGPVIDVEPEPAAPQPEAEEEQEGAPVAEARVLVARIPRAGDRWHQVHFNEAVVKQFFRIKPNSPQRLYLHSRGLDGSLGPEEVRPCVLSGHNLNRKIELGAHAREPYPAAPPIAVFREDGLRTFQYMLLMPGDPGYTAMMQLTNDLPSVGRGVPRVLTSLAALREAWPESPLV